MTIKIYDEMEQGTDEWMQARCGLLTASVMGSIITSKSDEVYKTGARKGKPKGLQYPKGCTTAPLVYEIAAQRITNYVEPVNIGFNGLRGHEDEIDARMLYEENFDPVREVGFITNDKWGFTLGYSPDGLVGIAGAIECKSRIQKYHVEAVSKGEVPDDFIMQIQTGLLVAELEWMDFISFSGGMPLFVKRVRPDYEIQDAIISAATQFERDVQEVIDKYNANLGKRKIINTERRLEEITL